MSNAQCAIRNPQAASRKPQGLTWSAIDRNMQLPSPSTVLTRNRRASSASLKRRSSSTDWPFGACAKADELRICAQERKMSENS